MLLFFTFLWGANFILAEVALRDLSPISFSVSRFAMGGIAMWAVLYYYIFKNNKAGESSYLIPKLEKKDWPRMLLVSVIGATLAPWMGIEGLNLTHGARASLWLAIGPAISTGFGYFFSTERIGKFGYLGVTLAGLGTFVLAFDGLQPEQGYWIGDLILIFALVLAVVELHLIRPLANQYGSVAVVALRTAIGGFLYLLVASGSLVEEQWLDAGIWTWIAILAGGAIGVGIGQWVKVRALKTLDPTQVVLYGNLVPLAAILIAWLTIGTNPSILEILASVLIISGAICIQVIDARITPRPAFTKQEEELSVVSSAKQD